MTRNRFLQQLESKLQWRADEIRTRVRMEVNELRNVSDHTVGDVGDRGLEAHASELASKLAEGESCNRGGDVADRRTGLAATDGDGDRHVGQRRKRLHHLSSSQAAERSNFGIPPESGRAS